MSTTGANRPASPADFRAWNEAMARKYNPADYHERSHPLIRWIERQRVACLRRNLDLRAGEMVMEVGCGAGNVLEALPDIRPIGIDLSPWLARQAQARLAGRSGLIVLAAAEALPFADGSLGRVVCSEVLEHVLSPEKAIAEITRVATADAVVVISVPNERFINQIKRLVTRLRLLTVFHRPAYRVPENMEDEWHLHEFDLARLRRAISGQLEIRRVSPVVSRWLPFRFVIAGEPVRRATS